MSKPRALLVVLTALKLAVKRMWATSLLSLAALVCFTVAAWSVSYKLGLVVAGVCLLVAEFAVTE